MDKGKAIELLKQALTEIPHLRKRHYDNQEFELWRNRVKTIVKSSLDADDWNILSPNAPLSIPIRGIATENQFIEHYQREITNYDTALKKIIQRHELLGSEEEPVSKTQSKDIAELPTFLFDKMQFHPKVVEASRSCFVAGNYREAILNAFISLIDYVKETTGLDLDGDDLMNQVFSFNYDKDQRRIVKYPIIRINKLANKSDRDEQQGFMFLCKGAAGGIRNPKAHKLIPQSNPLHTLEYLAFASLLIRRVEEGKVEI